MTPVVWNYNTFNEHQQRRGLFDVDQYFEQAFEEGEEVVHIKEHRDMSNIENPYTYTFTECIIVNVFPPNDWWPWQYICESVNTGEKIHSLTLSLAPLYIGEYSD